MTYQPSITVASPDEKTLFFEIQSCLVMAEDLWKAVQTFMERRMNSAEFQFSMQLVIRECLANAIIHGNRCDANKRVKVSVVHANESICLTVADEGNGFDWQRQRVSPLPASTTTRGRGLAMIAHYSREIDFNAEGNVITVVIGEK